MGKRRQLELHIFPIHVDGGTKGFMGEPIGQTWSCLLSFYGSVMGFHHLYGTR